MGKYDDIIDLPHPVSEKHPHMSMYDRAAQFSPFDALTGYSESSCADPDSDTTLSLDLQITGDFATVTQ